jgi:iron complex outermembrane receptor protein
MKYLQINFSRPSRSMIGLLMLSSLPVLASAETQQNVAADKEFTSSKGAAVLPEMTVTGQSEQSAKQTVVEKYKLPVTTESVTRDELDEKINVFNTEDAIKYEPSILVRKRYIGDTNAPVGTRTTTTSQSARTLIYADGILLSTLLNSNNGNTGSPRWNTVAPNEIERIDVLYGPFSAAYAGNSLGGVINITTKMPKKFEAYADAQASWQDFSHYGNKGTYETQNYAGGIGDRVNDFSFRFDYNHLDSTSQPVGYQVKSPTSSGLSAPANTTGAYRSVSNFGVAQYILGETQLYHTLQDNFKWKLAYDFSPTLKASYTLGMWENNQFGDVNSFLRSTANGAQVYPSDFSTKPTLAKQTTWSHGMNLHSETGGKFDWELIGSVVDLSEDTVGSGTYGQAAGTLTSMTGTNWHNVDAKGIWRPGDFLGNHEVSFGFHHDLYELVNPVYKTNNWQETSHLPLSASNTGSANSSGKTQTEGYWLQDSWDFSRDWNFTVGGRLESWHAYDGANSSIVNNRYQTVNQAEKNSLNFSPKGKLTWMPREDLKFGAAIAQAYRYPTVGEMFQTFTNTATNTLVTGNPNLKPEKALSSEISAEYFMNKGKLRLSFFQEQVEDAIYSTMSTLSNGSYASIISNVSQTDTYGIEFSGDKADVGIEGLDVFGSATWADARITDNSASDAALAALYASSSQNTRNTNLATNPHFYDASTSKLLPRIPEWRATFGATYRLTDYFSATVNGRYSGATFSQLNNSDTEHNQWLGNGSYFVVDTKFSYKLNKQFTLIGGIDNINNAEYFIFHPFPQRTYMAQLKFNY